MVFFFDEKQAVKGTERSIQGNFRKARKQAEMLYLDLSQTNVSIEKAVAYINGQIKAGGDVSESFNVVIENKDGIFSEFRVDINKKELVKSTFLSSPRSNPWSDSNIASNSSSVKPDVLAQAAYHGSAYLFDKFRTDKVNSGEGSKVPNTLAGACISPSRSRSRPNTPRGRET